MSQRRVFVIRVDPQANWIEDERFPQYIRLPSVLGMSLQPNILFEYPARPEQVRKKNRFSPERVREKNNFSLLELAGFISDAIDDKKLIVLGHVHLTPVSHKRLAIIRKQLDGDPVELRQTFLSNMSRENADVYVDGKKLFKILDAHFRKNGIPEDEWPYLFENLCWAFGNAKQRAHASSKKVKACTDWLIAEMRFHTKTTSPFTKDEYRTQAKERFGVGPWPFNQKCWRQASAAVKNPLFSKPGRRS